VGRLPCRHGEDDDEDCGIDDIEILYERDARRYRRVWHGVTGAISPREEV
jgi:hypothetical protein